MGRGAEYSIQLALDILKAVLAYEQMGKAPSTYELAQFLRRDQGVVIRYRDILKRIGLLTVEPEGPKNIIRLTEKGRCVARCLVS